ncbi:FAD-dependent oxidoreductase [Pendulispora rubella]|uniref:FAD-dependent oxidoreductase n=1 Tax=Pendulispora rubella TaxID=2741070 RepID=A0ABZ2KY22_9BACT
MKTSTLGRRALLKVAGFGAAAAAFGACHDDDDNPTKIGEVLDASPSTWDELRRKLRGDLVLPGDARYDTVRRAHNTLFDTQLPAAVAECVAPSDVQACIEAARRNEVRVAARSGGHSFGGYSTAPGSLVVDLHRLSNVVIDSPDTVIVAAGAQLIDVYAKLAEAGRCLPSGSCATVGISGITLGGGLGALTRKYGLTCDALLSADIVLADGSRRTVSPRADEDLYWALRGGGGGNFGIVTSFTFRTQPAPPVLTVFGVSFPRGSAVDVLGAWQFWYAAVPKELWSNCIVSGGAGNPAGIYVGGCFVGSASDLAPHIDNLIQRAGVQPSSRSATEKGYMDTMMYFAGCPTLTVEQCHLRGESDAGGGQLDRATFVGSSRVIAQWADSQKVADVMRDQVTLNLLIDGLGGAVQNLAPHATAFPHRQALATVQVYRGATAENRAESEQAVAHVQSALVDAVGFGAYVNYIDPRMADWGQAYYGANLARLQQVAKVYDADKFFDFPQSIHRT